MGDRPGEEDEEEEESVGGINHISGRVDGPGRVGSGRVDGLGRVGEEES